MIHEHTPSPWPWRAAALAACLVACWCFTCEPLVLSGDRGTFDALDEAYRVKAENPLADTSLLPNRYGRDVGIWSHGAKLTPRVVPALLLAAAQRAGLHPYWPAALGGCVLLGSMILTGVALFHDRVMGFLLGLTAAGLYASTACFAPATAKPFDGISLGLVAATMLASCSGSWATGPLFFLALWSDERAAVSACLMIPLFWLWRDAPLGVWRRPAIALLCGGSSWLVTRLIVGRTLGWSPSDMTHLGILSVAQNLPGFQFVVWSTFEAAIAPCLMLAADLLMRRRYREAAIWCGLLLMGTASVCAVGDISRGGAFLFVLIPGAFLGLARTGWSRESLRQLATATAIVTLAAPTFDFVPGFGMQFPTPGLARALQRLIAAFVGA